MATTNDLAKSAKSIQEQRQMMEIFFAVGLWFLISIESELVAIRKELQKSNRSRYGK